MRVVRIDERERPAISIEVAGASYLIKRVVTGVRQRWGEFMQLQGEALKQVDQLRASLEQAGEGSQEQLQREITRMNSFTEKIARQREEAERECIRLVLEKNGYELDWHWWLENTDSTDRQSFIVEALNKDAIEKGKKKAAS